MHSATKFLSGHGIVIGGLLVDGGRFDWDASGKFLSFQSPTKVFTTLYSPKSLVPLLLLREPVKRACVISALARAQRVPLHHARHGNAWRENGKAYFKYPSCRGTS